jgi:hypothetical protein
MLRQRSASDPPYCLSDDIFPDKEIRLKSRPVNPFWDVYYKLMAIRVNDFWLPIPNIFLSIIFGIIRFFQPLTVEQAKPLTKKTKILFVANHNMMGNDSIL